jgi:hypothetical protein
MGRIAGGEFLRIDIRDISEAQTAIHISPNQVEFVRGDIICTEQDVYAASYPAN